LEGVLIVVVLIVVVEQTDKTATFCFRCKINSMKEQHLEMMGRFG
jgi:hypothetical protein